MARSAGKPVTRRDALKGAAAGTLAAGLGTLASNEAGAQEAFDAIVIGSGFGGTIATIALSAHGKKTLVIERGTFWITPETLGAPTAPGNAVADWAKSKNLRVQYWPRPDHSLGLLDLLGNRYHDGNPYGLHHYSMFRDVHILTASAVGGGSMIYSNVNLRAKPAVLDRLGLKGIDYDRAERYMEKYRGKLSKVVTKIPLPPGVTPEQLGAKLDPDPDKLANKGYLLLDRSRALRDASGAVARQFGVDMPWNSAQPFGHRIRPRRQRRSRRPAHVLRTAGTLHAGLSAAGAAHTEQDLVQMGARQGRTGDAVLRIRSTHDQAGRRQLRGHVCGPTRHQ